VDTLGLHDGVSELGMAIYEKTRGNPFFFRSLLTSLNQDSTIRFDAETEAWAWDIIGIRSESVADNVAELLAANIGQLPAETRDVFALAACIGNRFDLPTLAMIAGLEEQEVVARLHVSSIGSYVVESGGTCEFGHDQVQQAALELIDRPQRMRRHLELARLLVTATGEEDLDERIFEIVAHYGLCTDLLTDAAEKLRVAELDLRAARKAKLSSAYGTAIDYLEHGLGLQGENGWEEHYGLTLALHDELIEAYNLDIRYQDVATFFATIRDHARIPVDARVAYQTMILMKIGQNELTEAITFAESYLGELGIAFDEELESYLSAEKLAALPLMEDPEKQAVLDIMMSIMTPLVYTAPERLPPLIHTMLNLVVRHGNSHVSCFAVSWYAILLCTQGRYEEGNIYGRLAVDLLYRFEPRGMTSKIMNIQCVCIRHWQTSIHDLLDPLEEYGRVGLRDGDFEWALYCLINHALFEWGTGTPLAVFAKDAAEYIGLCEGKQQEVTLFICSLFAESARNLAGESPHTTQLEGPWFSERNTLPRLEGNVFVLTFYSLVKTTLCFLFGAEEEARRHAADALATRGSISPHYLYTKISFYGGLAGLTGLAAGGEEADRGERLEQVDLCVQDLASWAASAPMNYGHKHKLLRAERARVANDPWQAVRSYEEAIAEARENRFVHEEALANELCGRFWLDQGNEKVARIYLYQARRLYERWGARAKVYHLEQSHPQLFLVGVAKDKQADVAAPVDPAQFDLDGIVGASQALSSETDLVRLVTRLMELMMTCSGASDVVLLLRRGEDWFVRARGDVAADERVLLIDLPYPPSAGDTDRGYVPAPVFDYCRRSHHTLVVGDVRQDRRFDANGDVRSRDARSLACLPVLHQGNLRAMLYLEHRLMTEVFTPDRMEILGHLSAQLGVSLENALLYEDLACKLEELRASEERYSLAVSGSAAGLWDWDLETDKVFYSDRLQELLGHEPGDFSDSLDEFWSRLHPEEEAAVRSTIDHHLENRDPFSFDYRLRAADGGFRWFHARGQASWSADGAAVRMSGSITDITERKQAEEDLARSEHHFRSLMEQSPLAVEILAPDGRITQVNSAWRRLWGVDETDAKRVLANYNMLEDEQIRERGFEQQVAAAFAGEAVILPPFQYDATRCANEIDLDDLEASAPWIQCHLSPVKDADGEILFVVNTYVDITELKQAEEEARKHQEALARVDRASSLGQLTGSIAHELNQPLTGILSNAQAAEMVLEKGLENRDELAEIMAEIVADTKRAGDVIRNLRALYREQVGDLTIVDLNVIVEETVRLLRSEIVLRHVSLTTERDPRVLEVLGNKIQIQQVVVNLVINAIQAMQDSDREVRRVRITTAHRGREAEVRVEDRGPGIDTDKIDHIFDPLATWKPGGIGIGLAISNAIIRAHGGRMWAKNRPGSGACVGYTLPLLKEGERR
jgi:PAS domain S-box-containing protein